MLKRGLAAITAIAMYAAPAGAEEARIQLSPEFQLRLSNDAMPATMDSEGRMKLYRLGADLELKLQDWLVPYIRGESSAFDFEVNCRGSTFPQSRPVAGLESGLGVRLPLYEDREAGTRPDADVYCGDNTVSNPYCFARLRYGF